MSSEASMSPQSELATQVVADLLARNIVSSRLRVDGDLLQVAGAGRLRIPTGGPRGTWRRTVNRSLMPRSVSAESRRHLLYAVLQDFVQNKLLLHHDTETSWPLAEFDAKLAPFDDVYRIPPGPGTTRSILFPIHIAIPWHGI